MDVPRRVTSSTQPLVLGGWSAGAARWGRSARNRGSPKPGRLRLLVTLVLVAAVGLLAAVPAGGAPAPVASAAEVAPAAQAGPGQVRFGAQFHAMWYSFTDAERVRLLDALAANGATLVRIDVSWRSLEPTEGMLDKNELSRLGSFLAMANSRGLSPLVMLWQTPRWVTGSADPRVPVTSAEGLAALTSLASRLAVRFASTVDAWEVWNEPNDDDFMRGTDPAIYAAMLKAAHAGFKAGDPASVVVFGGVSMVDDVWVRAALQAGAAGSYDVMGVHPYQAMADEPPEAPDEGNLWRLAHLPALLQAMHDVGDGDKPVWFTEFGWRTHVTLPTDANWRRGVSPATQADFLARTIALVRTAYPQVQRLYWYQDGSQPVDPLEAQYNLVLEDGTATAALEAVPGALAATGGVQVPPGSTVRVHTASPNAAVWGNVTAVGPAGAGFVRVWDCSLPAPPTSNLNASSGVNTANLTVSRTSGEGDVCIFNATGTHLIYDRVAVAPGGRTQAPIRLLDTRIEPVAAAPGEVLRVQTEAAGRTVWGNVTAASPTGSGHVKVWDCSMPTPATSNMNFSAGTTMAALSVVRASPQGEVCITASAPTELLYDLITSTETGADIPERLLDTRVDGLRLRAGQTVRVAAGQPGTTGWVTVAAATPAAAGHLRVWGCQSPMPVASSVNFAAGRTTANLALVQASAQAELCVYSSADTDVLVDRMGGATTPRITGPMRLLDTRIATPD